MSKHTQQLLEKLNLYIENITIQLTQLEIDQHANNQYSNNTIQQRFDPQLFKPITKHIDEYMLDITKNYDQLQQQVKNQNIEQISYLTQKIVDQITALQRELATQTLRKAEHQHVNKPTSEQNYQTLAQYQDYQRRLENMVNDRNLLLADMSSNQIQEKQQLEREVLQLTQRYARCSQAIRSLESKIELDEKNF